MGFEGHYSVPLVEAGEDDALGRPPGYWVPLGGPLDVDEVCEEVHPGVSCPHALPEVGGAVPARVRGIARATVVAEVEGQELGGLAGQLGRHRHPVGVYGEVHEGSAGQR